MLDIHQVYQAISASLQFPDGCFGMRTSFEKNLSWTSTAETSFFGAFSFGHLQWWQRFQMERETSA